MKTLFLVNPPERKGYSHERSLSGGLGVARKLKPWEKAGLYLPPPDMLLAAAVGEQAELKTAVLDLILEHLTGDAASNWVAQQVQAAGNAEDAWIGVRISLPTLPADLAFANAIKTQLPKARVFLFGSAIMTTLDHWIKESNTDALLYGEPEAVLPAMLAAQGEAWKTVPGVIESKTYVPVSGEALYDGSQQKRFAKWVMADALTELPFPAYHLLPMERYSPTGKTSDLSVYLTASRGCPIGCTMCPYMLHEGRPLRTRGVERVLDELEWLNKTWGIKYIRFRDPNFGFDRKQTRALLNGIIERGLEMDATVEMSLECADDDFITLMAQAGIKCITTGIETADEACLESIGQKIKVNDILEKKIKLADSLGIYVYGTYVIGAPQETWDSVRRTIDYSLEVRSEAAFTVMTPFPGTPMYYRALEEGLLDKEMKYAQWNSYEATVRSRALTASDLALARLWARLELVIPYRLYKARQVGGKTLALAHLKLLPRRIALAYVRAEVARRKKRGSPPVEIAAPLASRRLEKIPLTLRTK